MKIYRRKSFIILSIIIVLGLLGGGIYWGASRADDNKTAASDKTKEKIRAEEEISGGEGKSTKDKVGGQSQAQKDEPGGVPKNPGFIIKDTATYTIDDSALNVSITVSPIDDKQVKVDMNLAQTAQELSYIGEIISPTMAEILLNGGDRVDLVWSDQSHLKAVPVNGYFSEENLSDMKLLCESLNNKPYTATADAVGNQPDPSAVAVNMPANGAYYNSTNGGLPNTCDIRVYKSDDLSFKFSIWEHIDAQGKPSNKILLSENTAFFEDKNDTTAVYQGEDYTITFDCSKFRQIKVSGFDEALKLGDTFINMAITN